MKPPFQIDSGCPQADDRVAWYLRVSTPKQKLEHQREHVIRFCEQYGITIPADHKFEDKEARHRSAKRADFQRLLNLVRTGHLDWIVICSFDRWGVADVDEFFEFRRLLLKHDVQLWSVVDQMNLTGIDEGDYFRIVSMAIGATKYVEQMAEKNILKMIEMAKQGWAATGNAPYGTDLVCYPLDDLNRPLFRVIRTRYSRPHRFRVVRYTRDSRVERDAAGIITVARLVVADVEDGERMPARDKKMTGYRFEPSDEPSRIRAVQQMFELYASGMEFREISRNLWNQGYQHYDKPFGYHGVETILSNPVYIGLPAWGKIGVGAYRILHSGRPMRIRRKSTDTFVVRKAIEHSIQPLRPVFTPIVPTEIWQCVNSRLQSRPHANPHFGKRRTRSRTSHPLNGKLFCPDCEQPMVLGSSMPALGSKRKKTRCFNCGTYRRFSRMQCNANTVGWDRLDIVLKNLLATVSQRIDRVIADPAKALREEEWAKNCELTDLLFAVQSELEAGARNGNISPDLLTAPPPNPDTPILELVFDLYRQMHANRTQLLREELAAAEAELDRIGTVLLEGVPSQTVKKKLYGRMGELETRKQEVERLLVPTTARAESLIGQLKAISSTIEEAKQAEVSQLLDTFIEKAIPRFEVLKVGHGKRRAILQSVEFIPRSTEAAKNILPHAMEICATHTDMDSCLRPG